SGEQPRSPHPMEKTQPLPGNEPPGRRPLSSDPRAVVGLSAAQEPTGTQVLSPTAPVPSWRLEMQQMLASRRQAAASAPAIEPVPVEEMQQGGTLALPQEAIGQMAGAAERDPATTTTTAPLTQPEPKPRLADGELREAPPPQKKREAGMWLPVTIGV